MSAQFPDLSGQQLGGYKLERKLGEGGMASVYLSYQVAVKRPVAVKVLPPQLALQPGYLGRFEREVELATRLEHPHIMPIYDFGSQEGYSYIVMRFLDGGSLQDQTPNLHALADLLPILAQIASALDYAHENSIIHRDLKASNILFDKHRNAYLADFGIAKAVQESAMASLTGTDQIVGTPQLMSPEQWRGEALDGRADVYSFGVMTYQILAGEFPFAAPTPFAMMHKHLSEEPPHITLKRQDLPSHLNQVFERALAKERENRFGTAGQFVATLQEVSQGKLAYESTMVIPPDHAPTVLAHTPTAATDPTHRPTLGADTHPPTRSSTLPWLWLVLLLGVIVGGAVLLSNQNGASEVEAEATQTATVRPPTEVASLPELPEPDAIQRISNCSFGDTPRLCINFGSQQTRLEISDLPKGRIEYDPTWSPDGQQIAFSFLVAGGSESHDHQLYIVNRDGTGLRALPLGGNDLAPVWSPNGTWIAHHSGCDVRLISPENGESTSIFQGSPSACAMNIRWSPDAGYLAFLASPFDQSSYGVYIADFQNMWVKQLFWLDAPVQSAQVLWTPTGELLFQNSAKWQMIDSVCWQDEFSECTLEQHTSPYPKLIPSTWYIDTFPFWGGEVELPETRTEPVAFFIDTFEDGFRSTHYQSTQRWTSENGRLVSPQFEKNPNLGHYSADLMPQFIQGMEGYTSIMYFRFVELSPTVPAIHWLFLKQDNDCGANFTFHLHQNLIFLTQLPCHDQSQQDEATWAELDQHNWQWETDTWYEMRLTVKEDLLRLQINGETLLEHAGEFPFPLPQGHALTWSFNENTQAEIEDWIIAPSDTLEIDPIRGQVTGMIDQHAVMLSTEAEVLSPYDTDYQDQIIYVVWDDEIREAVLREPETVEALPQGDMWVSSDGSQVTLGYRSEIEDDLPAIGTPVLILLPTSP